jgi:hypothetical protein
MTRPTTDRWLSRLHGVAVFVEAAALSLAVAVVVIAVVPGSPAPARVAAGAVLDRSPGLDAGVAVDLRSRVLVDLANPSVLQEVLALLTVVPGLLLLAVLGRRIGALLRDVRLGDPFTEATAKALTTLAWLCVVGGSLVWVGAAVAAEALAATVADGGTAGVEVGGPVLAWLGVGLVFAAFGRLVAHGIELRSELDTVI